MTEKRQVKRGRKQDTVRPASKPAPAKTHVGRFDPWTVLKYPHLAEKSRNMVEFQNKLTFVVRRDARKVMIKKAIESLLGVKVVAVQTVITAKGEKKAYAKLSADSQASEIASRLGMV